jgi:hypothetical protein
MLTNVLEATILFAALSGQSVLRIEIDISKGAARSRFVYSSFLLNSLQPLDSYDILPIMVR